MANNQKLKVLQKVANNLKNDGYTNTKRAQFIHLVKAEGLVEKDTYVILKDNTKAHGHRGFYSVERLLEELAIKLGETTKVELKEKRIAARQTDDTEGAAWGSIAYTEDDIAEELAIMGTTI